MVDVRTDAVIHRPRAEVAAYAADPSNAAEWYVNMKSVEWQTPPPLQKGPFPMETTYAWEDVGDGATRMTLHNRGEPRGFAKLGAPIVASAMRRANAKDLARLKELLETRDAPR